MPDKDTHHIECCCHDLDHTSKLWYDDEYRQFDLTYKLVRFPRDINHERPSYTIRKDDKLWQKIYRPLKFKFQCIVDYFRCIARAIKGVPIWFDANASWEDKEIIGMIKFMISKMDLNNNQIRDLVNFIEKGIDLPKISKMDYLKND